MDTGGWFIVPIFKMLKKRAVIIASAGGGGLKATVKDIKDSMDYCESQELILSVKVFGDIFGTICPINLKFTFEKT